MIKFLKVVWYLSVLIIFFFITSFEGYRIFDYLKGNYAIKKMSIKKYSFDSSSKRRSITIEGNINDKKVFISEFDSDIDKLHELYPTIFSNNKSIIIRVFEFKNSNKVLLINEFDNWKKNMLLSTAYIIISLLLISTNFLSKKYEK